jgi:hypothetical protein
MSKRKVLCKIELGETTAFGVVREKFPEIEKYQSNETNKLKDFIENEVTSEELMDVEDEVDGKVIKVKYLSGKANSGLRESVKENFKDVELETSIISGEIIDKFRIAYKDIRPTSGSLKGILFALLLILVAYLGMIAINPERYKLW